MRVHFHAGDRVRVACRRSDGLFRGEIPNGTEGTVRGLREASTAFNSPGETTTMAVVNFPGVGDRCIAASVLDLVSVAAPADKRELFRAAWGGAAAADVKARDLAHAHEKVAEAYKALAYALNDLRAVEGR